MNIENNNAVYGAGYYDKMSANRNQAILAEKQARNLAEVGRSVGQAAGEAVARMPISDTYTPASAQVQTREASGNPFSSDWGTRGYSVDINGNGRFDRGADAVVVLDYNGDGRLEDHEITATGDMMRAARNNYDFNNDGSVSNQEAAIGYGHRQRFAQLDLNRDGRLSNDEMSRGGFHAWQDHNGDGQVNSYEAKSLSNISIQGGFGRIDQIDPYSGQSQVSVRGYNASEQQMIARVSRMFGQTY